MRITLAHHYSRLSGWVKHHNGDLLAIFVILGISVSFLIPNRLLPGQWLIGWDNINPEFNLPLNISRAIFSVWQEYQGTGLLAGMAHAADLPRLLVLWILSVVIPANYLRFTWVWLMFATGAVGLYVLLQKSILPRIFPHASNWQMRLGALTGAVFLLTNFATRQTFYTPFEPFVTHFGFLPWLIYTAIAVLERPTRKRIIWFSLINLLAAPQGYVQTIFISYLIVLTAISLFTVIAKPSRTMLLRIILVYVMTFCINAFWLIPTVYFLKTGSQVTVNAKINQMATDEAYLKNKAAGTLDNTLQMKGFWFDTYDFDPQKSVQTPILGYWRTYTESPVVTATMYALIGIAFIGIITVLAKKDVASWWIIGVYVAGITLLTINTPPFSWINTLLDHIPLFYQAFRLRFTKINTMTSVSDSILFGIGVLTITLWLQKIPKVLREVAAFLLMVSFVIISFPVFQGQFFYDAIKLSIPKDYDQLFAYFAKEPAGRIMDLPQHMYWGWTYYRWGYIGWGFPWYGIEQPIADRAFDVWSQTSENYYWELSRSLYSKNPADVVRVMDKYDIRYIVLDEYVISPSSNRALFIGEIKKMLASIPSLRKEATFGKLTVYRRIDNTDLSFVSEKINLPAVSPPYQWTDNDVAYAQLGDYFNANGPSVTYPFRSLFTKRSVSEREFRVTETPTVITIGSDVTATTASILKASALVYDSEKTPDLSAAAAKPCGLFDTGQTSAANMVEFPLSFLRFTSQNNQNCLSYGVPTLSHRNGYLVAVEARHIAGRPLLISFINQTAKHVEEESYLPVTPDWQTTYFVLPPLAPDGLGYGIYLSNSSIGQDETVNDIRTIRMYQIPYDDMVMMHSPATLPPHASHVSVNVFHPNPAFYRVTGATGQGTVILSQSFNRGWIALDANFKPVGNHVLVDNWENGWQLNPGTTDTIYIIFWPQILEFIGFALLPLPFLFARKLASP